MSEYVIKSHCHINTNRESDTFVGLDCRNEELTVNFPLGYQLSDNDSGIRKDILLLMRTLALASFAQNSTVNFSDEKAEYSAFPLQEYLFIISDFFSRGYYQERESYYSVSPRGKIDWKRTIKTQSPYICIGEAVSDWKHNQKTYEHIFGILVDVKHLMNLYCRSDTSEIEQLAQCIKHFCCHK